MQMSYKPETELLTIRVSSESLFSFERQKLNLSLICESNF